MSVSEEIDIIELLQRVKEGKAPKEIEIEGVVYERNTDDEFCDYIETMYEHDEGPRSITKFWTDTATLSTKIKILDKPIIEEIQDKMDTHKEGILKDKINEIIRVINNKEQDIVWKNWKN